MASRDLVGCQGDVRNGHRGIELKCPVLVDGLALPAALGPGAGKFPRGLASTCGCATWSRANGISEHHKAQNCHPGPGAEAGEFGDYLLRLPGENDFKSIGRQPRAVRWSPMCIVRTAAALATRWSATRRPCATTCARIHLVASARDDYGVVLRDDLTLERPGRCGNGMRYDRAWSVRPPVIYQSSWPACPGHPRLFRGASET